MSKYVSVDYLQEIIVDENSLENILHAPAEYIVDLIKCKECKYFSIRSQMPVCTWNTKKEPQSRIMFLPKIDPNGFCSNGSIDPLREYFKKK